jgi:putative endonuclease
MCYVYVLSSLKHKRLYIGSSAKPDERLSSHNAGRVISTRKYRPWQRILLEEHPDRSVAVRREKYLKSGWGRAWITKTIIMERWQSG